MFARVSRLGRALLLLASISWTRGAAQTPGPEIARFIAVRDSTFVLRHVRVIDGTGAAARDDQSIVVANGRITAVGPAGSTPAPAGAKQLDYAGHTVLPGLVGMHEHLYYTASISDQLGADGALDQPGYLVTEIPSTAPRLYLAAGVTTARTTGSVEPYTDLEVKARIESGHMPGPRLDLTGPYLEGPGSFVRQMHAAHRTRRRRTAGGLLGRRGHDVVQGLHAAHPRRAAHGHRATPTAAVSRSPDISARSPGRRRSRPGSTASSTGRCSPIPSSCPTRSPTPALRLPGKDPGPGSRWEGPR